MRDFEFTFGIEEEFFLVHPRTRNVTTRLPKRLVQQAQQRLGKVISHELLQSQIEISSPVLHSCDDARRTMSELRQGLAEVAAEQDLKLLAAGTHPLAAWTEQVTTDKSRYHAVMEDFQIIGRRNLLCGLHVHVAVPPQVDRIDVMNRAMRWLPTFLALSTSSPFWNRQRTGLLSYRQSAYDEWPRSGIPEFFADEAQYGDFIALLQRGGAIRDPTFIWWAIRPAARFPTLELRISDSCTRLADTLAIAALFRCLIATLVREPELGHGHKVNTRLVIEENRWRAKRDGIEASFIDDATGEVMPFRQALDGLRRLLQPAAQTLDCCDSLDHLDTILEHGTSAHRQLALYRARRDAGDGRLAALRAVVDWLLSATDGSDATPAASPTH